jgi:hypothetical protein
MEHSSDACEAFADCQRYDDQYSAENPVGIDEVRRQGYEEGYQFALSESRGEDPSQLGPIDERKHPGEIGEHSPDPCAAFQNGRRFARYIRCVNVDEIELANYEGWEDGNAAFLNSRVTKG